MKKIINLQLHRLLTFEDMSNEEFPLCDVQTKFTKQIFIQQDQNSGTWLHIPIKLDANWAYIDCLAFICRCRNHHKRFNSHTTVYRIKNILRKFYFVVLSANFERDLDNSVVGWYCHMWRRDFTYFSTIIDITSAWRWYIEISCATLPSCAISVYSMMYGSCLYLPFVFDL